MPTKRFKRTCAALAAMTVIALPSSSAFARADHPPGGSTPPRAGSGLFTGVSAWGTGAPGCSRHETSTMLTFDCSGIESNFIGSFVLIRFPSKNFRAVVQLRQGSDPRFGLAWTEQDTTVLTPLVGNHGIITGSQSVTLTGASVPYSTDWDIGVDSVKVNGGFPLAVNAQITITRT
jgi:hypothetical protein